MPERTFRPLSELIGKDLTDDFEKLKSGDLIFRCSFEQIAKHFLSYHLPIKTFAVDFKTLRDEYLTATNKQKETTSALLGAELHPNFENEIPTEEQEFYNYICKSYFEIVKEPRQELLSLYEKATSHIREIDITLKNIQDQLDTIHKRNDTIEIQEKKPVLYYYQGHNQKAREQVMNFLLHEIKAFALYQCYDRRLLPNLWHDMPYNYSWNSKSYKPEMPHDLDNKFGHFAIPKFYAIKEKYTSDKPAFNQYLHEYIAQDEIIFSINNLLTKHHLLNARSEIITEALNIYVHGAKIMFAGAVPTIIEGILHELCLMIGENENELLQKGFQYKLDQLLHVLGYELYYEYYSFRFRIFRNKVAHGRLTKADVEELADLLLLDLHHICNLVFSTKFKSNQKRFVIEDLNKNLSKPDYKYLIEYIHLSKELVPDFYNLQFKIDEVEKMISSDGFWAFLSKELDEGGEITRHGIVRVTKLISARKPFDERCLAIFKKAALAKPDITLADDYLQDLRKWY